MWNSKVVFLDEPTAALGVAQTRQVLDLIRRLREQGLGIVVITHNIEMVFEIADRITILRLGRRVATFNQEETTPQEVVSVILGAQAA
jgi:D-xylose transport system ATP-binding protein